MSVTLTKPAGCLQCPYFSIGKGFVPDLIPPGCEILLQGEAPGETEVREKRPFCGGAGNYLVALTRRAGLLSPLTAKESEADLGIPERLLRKHKIGLANVLRCQPPKNHYPVGKLKTQSEACCRQYDKPLPALRVVVTLGQHAFKLWTKAKKGGITLWRGSVLPITTTDPTAPGVESPWGGPGAICSWSPVTTLHRWVRNWSALPAVPVSAPSSVWLVPTLHPAALMRSPKGWPDVVGDLEKAKQIRDEGWEPPLVRPVLLHSVEAVKTMLPWLAKQSKPTKPVICDIENTTKRYPVIECVGFSIEAPTGFTLPLTRISGEAYWTPSEFMHVEKALQKFFSTAYVGFHHGMHDVPILERDFGPIKRWVFDSCYLHAACYGELSHKLSYVQSVFSPYPQHKTLMKLDDDKGVK